MMKKPDKLTSVIEKAKNIKLLILDVDGVLTDAKLFFDNQGNEYKAFHARDGHGIKLLRKTGVEVAVISGRSSESVALRMKMLGIEHIYQGRENKLDAFFELIGRLNIEPAQAAHVGDDVLDLPIMVRAGLAVAVADAHAAVRQRADWCTELPGGHGAVREVCDLIMQAQGSYDAVLNGYLT